MKDSELLNIFWGEVTEYLEALNKGLLQIEMLETDDKATFHNLVREMNRVAHSMKGAARAVNLGVIEAVSHYMETVFESALKDAVELTPDNCDTIYDGLDVIQNICDGEENDEEALATVLSRLEQMVATAPAPDATSDSRQMPAVHVNGNEVASVEETTSDIPDVTLQVDDAPQDSNGMPRSTQTIRATSLMTGQFKSADMGTVAMRPVEDTVRITVSKLDRLMAEATELLIARMHGEEQHGEIRSLRQHHAKWQREWRGVRAAYIRLVRRYQENMDEEMGSELPIILRFLESNQRYLSEAFRNLTQLDQSTAQYNMQLSTLADQLQDDISRMRMTPFETVIGGFQRVLRDLARDVGKQVQFDVIGLGVDIDKTVLDALKDPLLHLLRNAVDHGIEMPNVREASGKSAVGHIQIVVEQRGSEIVIRVSDDGKGIDTFDVRLAIIDNGILSESEAAGLSDDDVRMYVFHPGLSTKKELTTLSGRGLGMDIVRDRVESLRGRVSLHSVIGEGTTTTINVPVSLTRIRCVLIRLGEQNFAIPSAMVIRMGEIDRDEVFTAEGREMLLINERPTPLASLGAILDVPMTNENDLMKIVTLQATDRAVTFEVDDLYSEQELVLKPLGTELARAPYVAGAALLGSGAVIVVLDVNDLVRQATGTTLPRRRVLATTPAIAQRRVRVLVVDDSITTRTLEKNILETAGFEVHVAMDGLEAWRMLPENDFDVVISDVEMPNMNGLQLATQIKSSQYRDIPIILLTSLAKPEQREAGLRAGADAYLVKSRFDQGELLETIQSVMLPV